LQTKLTGAEGDQTEVSPMSACNGVCCISAFSEWQAIFGLPDSFHSLASNAASEGCQFRSAARNLIFVPEPIAGPVSWWRRTPEAL